MCSWCVCVCVYTAIIPACLALALALAWLPARQLIQYVAVSESRNHPLLFFGLFQLLNHLPSSSHLIQIQHLVPSDAPCGLDVLHGQGEVDPSGVRQVEVVGVVLVPLLHGGEHLLLIGADDV